jgi:hypothetical protein
VDEWLVSVIKSMYASAVTAVRSENGVSRELEVKVGVHQGSVLSPLLFTIVLEALSETFRGGLPWELLYADDLALIAESEEELLQKIKYWKEGVESKGLRVNVMKTKVLKCQGKACSERETGKWPCSVCRTGVGRNSILCTACKKWVHKKCSRRRGSLKRVRNFVCSTCSGGGLSSAPEKKELCLGDRKLECVSKFCYLGDMIAGSGGAEEASIARVRCAWAKFRELSGILTRRGASLKLNKDI